MFAKKMNYKNRSKAISDIIKEAITEKKWSKDKYTTGCIVLLYNHTKREILKKLLNIQHHYNKFIISTQHIHLNKELCLELIAVKGKTKNILKLKDAIRVIKGVEFCKILAV